MLCEECGNNPAEVVMTTVVGSQAITRHLCRSCLSKYQAENLQTVLAAVLSSLVNKTASVPDIACPRCGETYAEFQKTGMLGCADCYQAFRKELTPLLRRAQGPSQHAGRRPPVSEEDQARLSRMEELRKRMETAVAEENFEEAARLRDEIKAMTPAREEKA